MMKKTITLCLLTIIGCLTCATSAASGIGTWNVYMAYHDITDIKPAGNIIYVLSSNGIFSYNVNDQSITAYNKVNSLSDSRIEHIGWNAATRRLIITYDNYNIDLLDNNGDVINISDYYSKTLALDKTINKIYVNDIYAYLCTNFGILKINMRSAEISETYTLGLRVHNCVITGNKIYIHTSDGMYGASLTDNLIDRNNWRPTSEVGFDIFAANSLQTTTAHGYSERRIYDKTNRCFWSNQKDGRLQSYTEADDGTITITRRDISPDGPIYNHFGFIKYTNGRLYTCGSYIWDNHYNAVIQTLDNTTGQWTIFQDEGIKEQTGVNFTDMLCLDVDPLDNRHVTGGSRNGIYEFYDGQFIKFHNSESTNGLISTAIKDNKEYELITAMCFDRKGQLWSFNSRSYTEKPLLCLARDGNMTAFGHNDLLTYKDHRSAAFIKSMIIDSYGHLWFANNDYDTPAAYRYDTDSDVLYTYKTFYNQDGLSVKVGNVSSLAEDADGNIWFGTNCGPLMLNREQVADPSSGITQIKIPRNDGSNFADYLLSETDVTCIAIDGANRKWIGTSTSGLYLISSDNMEEIHHFTAENSHLLSNTIESLTIDNRTGEVFAGTSKGLCSYMSDATAPNEDMNKDNVYAYPNPVTPGYTGLITVTGLSFNADVKILASNGAIVAEGRSTGGTFVWDGNDRNGRRVASGVYMVATAKEDGSKGTVCKIAIIN